MLVSAFWLSGTGLLVRAADLPTTSTNWLSSAPIEVKTIRELSSSEASPYSINGNRDCVNTKVVTRPERSPLQSEQSFTDCAVETNFGSISASGYMRLAGTDTWGKLQASVNGLKGVIPIPRSDTVIIYEDGPGNSLYLTFDTLFSRGVGVSTDLSGQVTYTIKSTFPMPFADRTWRLLPAQIDSLAFSSNGKWVIVDVLNIGMVRVSLENFSVLPFDDPFNYNVGVAPGIQTTISDDGRFAIVGSSEFSRLRLYDLDTCGPVPERIQSKVSCQYRELTATLQQQIPGFSNSAKFRMIGNTAFQFYARHTEGSSITKTAQYRVGLSGSDPALLDYLAMGDSFASGEGAYSYKTYADTSNNHCHISSNSYPYTLGESLSLSNYQSVACSGAKLNDITNQSITYNDSQSQAKGKPTNNYDEEIYANFLPGYRAQIDFVKKYRPTVVTISTFGNDTGMLSKLKRCLEPDTCFSSYEDRIEVVREINSQFSRLRDMYAYIKQLVPESKIYALDYPVVAKADGNCAVNVRLNSAELQFTTQLIQYLNRVIKRAADSAGVAFVDIQDSFTGHRLCEASGSQIALNGLTAGNDIFASTRGPFGNESYHPNNLGHQLMASVIKTKTNDFRLATPQPIVGDNTPTENDAVELLQAPRSGRAIQSLNYDDSLSNDVLYREAWWQTTINGAQRLLKSKSPYQVIINSDPVTLGTFTNNDPEQLDFRVKIPSSVSTGFHTLRIVGQNTIGEPISIYKSVYVAANQQDFDGDGINNTNDPCIGLGANRLDIDLDGIDDACDAVIESNPLLNGLYRVRNGDTAKSEQPGFVYLERQTQLSHQAFGFNDYDPDGDGWALVAKSAGEGTGGQLAKYWLSEDSSKPPNDSLHYIPHIATRSNKKGCLQLIAADLGTVRKTQKRIFVVDTQNTATCSDPTQPDRDHDGIPDGQQDLYRIRYGSVDKNEKPNKIYIERNIYAAEAQLGISDYSQQQDGWALMGLSQGDVKPYVKSLALVDPDSGQILKRYPIDAVTLTANGSISGLDEARKQRVQPVVLIEQANSTCRVIVPIRLDVVKKGQQHRVKPLQELKGVSCM